MEQISNTVLVQAISELKKTQEFKKFLRLCKKRLVNFDKKKVFTYKTLDASGKKISKKCNFNSDKEISKYVSLLASKIEEIICADSEELLDWKNQFDVFDLSHLDPDIFKGFISRIQQLLQYKTFRSGEGKLIFQFYRKLNIKACVYCNSQHVILLKNSKVARLQADHNLPKAKYPYLSISLANLYPSCNNCNHLKKEEDVEYFLYYNIKPNRELRFSIDDATVADFYLKNIEDSDVKIEFDQGSSSLEKVLKISEIYENHTDYAVDLLRKHKVYNKSYVTSLINSFDLLIGTNEEVINRMIFGSTLDDKDINLRVFSKLTNDLKKQLDVLNSPK